MKERGRSRNGAEVSPADPPIPFRRLPPRTCGRYADGLPSPPGWRSKRFGGDGHESRHYRGSIAGCATAALLHRAGHDVIVFERSESDLVSRGAGILMTTAAWQDMMAHGLIDGTLPACRADYSRLVTRASGTGQQRWLGDFQ